MARAEIMSRIEMDKLLRELRAHDKEGFASAGL